MQLKSINMEEIESPSVSGYRYRKDKENKDKYVMEVLQENGCRGRMKMLHDNILSTSKHNSAPEPGKNEASKFVSAICRWALEGVEKPRQIIQKPGVEFLCKLHLIYRDTQHCSTQVNTKRKANSFHIQIFKI